MKSSNWQFGELEYEEHHVLTFPSGIIGFEQLRTFVLVDYEDTEPFRWLISLQDQAVSFPVLEASRVVPDYVVPDDQSREVFFIACLSSAIEESTVNLRSPVVIDNVAREGKQVIIENELYSMQFPLFPPAPRLAER
jgi:flagellar assembly factor FliW